MPFESPGAYGDIRVGAHYIDGVDGVVAHAYYPPPNGYSAAGDLHFDSSETWACDPSQITSWEIDIGLVALHELGHSIGLGHEPNDPAVMEPIYNPSLNFGPVADDIIGITEICGGSPLGNGFFGGDIGIGTDHPLASLHVKKADGTAQVWVEEDSATVSNTRRQFFISNNGSPNFAMQNDATGDLWFFQVDASGSFVITKSGSGVQEFAVKQGGDVVVAGLGVVHNAPDYVFDPNYDLTPLTELEQYVSRERHLPNVPSAQEMKEQGLSLANLQLKLLEKIEELTLYTIEQQKTIQLQQEALAELKLELDEIRAMHDGP